MNYNKVQRSLEVLAASVRSIHVLIGVIVSVAMLAACEKEVQVVEVPVEVAVEVPVEVPNCQLRNFDGGRSFVVEAWGLPDEMFDIGEPLQLQMRASAAAHISVYYISSSCKVARLLNNYPVKATEIVDFPTRASGLVMTVKPPAGEEAFYFIATREPLDFLASGTGGDIMGNIGETTGIASLDLSVDQFYRRLQDAKGRINPDDWSARTLRTQVIAH